jgi:hypothetical protein
MNRPILPNSRGHRILKHLTHLNPPRATLVEMMTLLGLGRDKSVKDEFRKNVLVRLVDVGFLVQVTATQWELTGRGRKYEIELRPGYAVNLTYVDAEKVKPYQPNVWEGTYTPPKPIAHRPGADQWKDYPSLQGNRRVYQDGRVERS